MERRRQLSYMEGLVAHKRSRVIRFITLPNCRRRWRLLLFPQSRLRNKNKTPVGIQLCASASPPSWVVRNHAQPPGSLRSRKP